MIDQSGRGSAGKLLNTSAAAEFLSVSEKTLAQWRWRGGGPKFCKLGRLVRYRVEDLHSFVEVRSKASTADAN